MSQEQLIAVFVDFENLALGVRELKGHKFDIEMILKDCREGSHRVRRATVTGATIVTPCATCTAPVSR
jgi:hypothetical protein